MNMNVSLTKTCLTVLIMAIFGLSGCKKAETVSAADLLGTWEMKSWVSADPRFGGCDMLGTLEFSEYAFSDRVGTKVVFTYVRAGILETATGYARIDDPPRVYFYVSYFGRSIDFDGIYEDGRMIGRLGGSWSGSIYYNNDEWWEAVKK